MKSVFLGILLMACLGLSKDVGIQAAEVDALGIQGEYSGVMADRSEMAVGAQLIALGDDQFRLTLFEGGLPGASGSADPPKSREEFGPAKLQNGKLLFSKGKRQLVYENQGIQLKQDGKPACELKRVVRKSVTLNQKPPEGAIVLFDGTNGDQFKLLRGEGDPMIDGELRQGITSEDEFAGDFTLHIEFKLPFEPTKSGQGRGNSGIYMQGRYEVQMLDSFGLTGEQNECGGIYSVKKPDVNMCYPPESWQTYDIDFQSAKWDGETKTDNARMTVRHNGVVIHDNVEVPKTTTAAPRGESAEPGFLYLQDHGSPVRYRNIWLSKR